MFMFKKSQPSTSSTHEPRSCHLPLSEILKATNDFDESSLIGSGSIGDVYKGEVFNGETLVLAAIKRLNRNSILSATATWPDVENLSTFRHQNLVSLIGYCNNVNEVKKKSERKSVSTYEKEIILVCEYIPNGTLKDHLHVLRTPLSWIQRLNICIGVARALHYLHTRGGSETDTTTTTMHGDIKSDTILLTESWTAKVSDFGLGKAHSIHDAIVIDSGSMGYVDPYFIWSTMSDVYSFGVLLLEVLCRKPAFDEYRHNETPGLLHWFRDSVKRMSLEDIIDSDIRNEISSKSLKDIFAIAQVCSYCIPHHRPDMGQVVTMLEHVLADSSNRGRIARFPEVPADSDSYGPNVKEFTFKDLEKATQGFSRDLLLSEGGSRKVFLGWVEQNNIAPSKQGSGIAVAIEWVTSEIPKSYKEWLEEVNFLGRLAHPNIIRLIGYCSRRDGHEHLLVYEHMKKSLSHFIHGDESLSWKTRLHIMIGVVRGLMYLYTTKGVLCQFQCSDILLDEDFTAKIGGFGWIEFQERHDRKQLKGAFGYLNGDYTLSGQSPLINNDIYSFGLVLLETITGKHLHDLESVFVGLDSLDMQGLKSKSNRRRLKKMMDARLKDNYSPEGAFKCMALASRCIVIQPELRPSRAEILWHLEQVYALNK